MVSHTNNIDLPNILLIDDSRLVRVSIKRIINDEFNVIEAGDGEEGWDLLQKIEDIRVIITDAGMPKLDGYDLIARVRQASSDYFQRIPIIMVTGAEAGESKSRERALKLGATDFVTKPFDKTELLARVRALSKLDETQKSLVETEAALEVQSTINPITNINNKKYFIHRGAQEIAYSSRHKQDLAFMGFALDNFEHINKKLGQKIAQQVLRWLANGIKNMLRTEDSIAHIDTNTFAIIAPTANFTAAKVLAERIRKTVISQQFKQGDCALNVSISLSIACLANDSAESIEEFLALISERVQQAQQAGGNQVFIRTPPTDSNQIDAVADISLDKVLAAINNGDYSHYQNHLPQIASKLYPLMLFCNEQLQWKLDSQFREIKNKLAK